MSGERKFYGKTWDEMYEVLETICKLEDEILMTDEEQVAYDIAIQCVTQIMNRQRDGKKIKWG